MDTLTRAHELAAELTKGYREQARLYSRMLYLSAAQRDHIEARGPTYKVLSLLQRKGVLILSISSIEDRLEPLKHEWLALPDSTRSSADRELNPVLDDLASIIAQIVAAERESERMLTEQMEEVGQGITKLNAGARATKAYQPVSARPAPRFMDQVQ